MPSTPKPKTTRMSLDLPPEHHKAIKSDAFEQEITAMSLMRALVERWYEDNELRESLVDRAKEIDTIAKAEHRAAISRNRR